LIVGNTNNEGGFYKLLDASHSGAPLPTRGPATGADPSSGSGCGAHAAAAARVAARVPAWRYVYSGEFPNQDIGVRGAWHGSEIGLVFGTSELLSHRPDTEEERKLSARLRAVWAGFARNPRTAPAEIGGWPFYDAKKETVVRIGGENSSAIAYVARAKYDAACP
jgi:carboxylesterase type B